MRERFSTFISSVYLARVASSALAVECAHLSGFEALFESSVEHSSFSVEVEERPVALGETERAQRRLKQDI